ncbi:MAG: hypothetical protein LBT75_03670 [Bacilli bacterium]|nr:hypothetical protein [Bacilli bacterium]
MKKSSNNDFNEFFDIIDENYIDIKNKYILIKSNVSGRFYLADDEFINEFKSSDLESFKEVMHYIDCDCQDFEVMPISIFDNDRTRIVRVD